MFAAWMNFEKASVIFVSSKENSLTFPNFVFKFPDFFKFHEIPWLFPDILQVPQNFLTFPGFQKFQVCWPRWFCFDDQSIFTAKWNSEICSSCSWHNESISALMLTFLFGVHWYREMEYDLFLSKKMNFCCLMLCFCR